MNVRYEHGGYKNCRMVEQKVHTIAISKSTMETALLQGIVMYEQKQQQQKNNNDTDILA